MQKIKVYISKTRKGKLNVIFTNSVYSNIEGIVSVSFFKSTIFKYS